LQKQGVKEGGAAGNLIFTVALYAGANQSPVIVEHLIVLFNRRFG